MRSATKSISKKLEKSTHDCIACIASEQLKLNKKESDNGYHTNPTYDMSLLEPPVMVTDFTTRSYIDGDDLSVKLRKLHTHLCKCHFNSKY